jgi:hypothetical protein
MEEPVFDTSELFDPYDLQQFNLAGRQSAIHECLHNTGALGKLAMRLVGWERQLALHPDTEVTIGRRRPPHVEQGPFSQLGIRFRQPAQPPRGPWQRFLHVATTDENGSVVSRRGIVPELAVDYIIDMCLDLDAARLPDPQTGQPAALPDLAPDLMHINEPRAVYLQPPAEEA